MRDETADVYARVHNRVDEILHYVWDPVGIVGIPEARDEYDSYVATVVKMLFEGADAEKVARHLHSIAWDEIGLTKPKEETREVADMLVKNYQWVRGPDELPKKA